MNEDILKQALKQAVSMSPPVPVNNGNASYVKFNDNPTQKIQRTDNVYKKRG